MWHVRFCLLSCVAYTDKRSHAIGLEVDWGLGRAPGLETPVGFYFYGKVGLLLLQQIMNVPCQTGKGLSLD